MWERRGVGPLGALGCDLPAQAEPMAGTWTWYMPKPSGSEKCPQSG